MTDAERLRLLLDVANERTWVDGEDPGAAALRSEVERAPMARRDLKRRLRDFVADETSVIVDRVGMKVREWTPRFQIAGLRSDLTDHEIEAIRLEELRFMLTGLLTGDAHVSLTVSIGLDEGEQTVSGQFPDVVMYLAVRLLADSGLTIGTCEAPEAGEPGYPNAFENACGKLFVVVKGGERRRLYCSDACKQRAKNPKWKARGNAQAQRRKR